MTEKQLKLMSIAELLASFAVSQMDVMQPVAAYEASCRAAGDAHELNDSSAKINRLTKLQFAIEDQLAERPNGLQALELLFSSTSAWVRYSAAQSLLDIIPQQARAVIQAVADSKDYPVAGHAAMTLTMFDGDLSHLRIPRRRHAI